MRDFVRTHLLYARAAFALLSYVVFSEKRRRTMASSRILLKILACTAEALLLVKSIDSC